MGEVLSHPAKPLRAWVAYPVEQSDDPYSALWVAVLTGFPPDENEPDQAPPVSFPALLDIFRHPEVRMGLPILFKPLFTALGGAA